jgi:hypothetical protein
LLFFKLKHYFTAFLNYVLIANQFAYF